MNDQGPFPRGLALGTIIVFVTMVLGACLLIVFLYNLPVIFPPPGGRTLGGLIPTRTPALAALVTPPPSLTAPIPTITPPLAPTPLPPVSATLAPTPLPPAPAPASGQGQVVFVTERKGFNSIFAMNPDGTNQHLLVPHQGSYYDYSPAVSPDGRRLAFSSNREGPGTDNIYIMNMDGTDLHKITSTPGFKNASSSWFPDNRRLAFVSNRTGHWQVYTMNDDGSAVRQVITSNQDTINVAVSPNGALLAYTCAREICVANSDGTNARVLLQNGLPKDHLAWSPDSSLIAYTQANVNTNKTSIFVLDLQGNARELIANGGWPAWSPDGHQIVFSSDMPGVANLYVYNLDTGQVNQVTRTSAADVTPVWAR